jgi:large subunit ribosomal protein L15
MDRLSNLKYAEGSTKKPKRIGRGEGSGHGGTATKGMNGQLSRSGARKKRWFEGGQMPLQRRIPKFGFTNIFKAYYQIVNVDLIEKLVISKKLKETVINPEILKKHGLISSTKSPVKLLGNGDLKTKLIIQVNAFSRTAKDKVEAVGGTIEKIQYK